MSSLTSYFPPRLLHAVHSIELISSWLLVFQARRNFNFLAIFLTKFGLFLINNLFLPISIPLNNEIFSDFLLLLLSLFWFRPTRLISVLKSDSFASYPTLFLRLFFYSLFALFRTWSICLAVERYKTDAASLWVSCLVLLEFSSLVFLFKTRDFRKFSSSLIQSILLSTLVTALHDQAEIVALTYFIYRHVVSLVVQKSTLGRTRKHRKTSK